MSSLLPAETALVYVSDRLPEYATTTVLSNADKHSANMIRHFAHQPCNNHIVVFHGHDSAFGHQVCKLNHSTLSTNLASSVGILSKLQLLSTNQTVQTYHNYIELSNARLTLLENLACVRLEIVRSNLRMQILNLLPGSLHVT